MQAMTTPAATPAHDHAAHDPDIEPDVIYALYAVFRARTDSARLSDEARDGAAAEVQAVLDQAAAKEVDTRGSYDVAGYRADADLMFWWTASSPDDLQEVYSRFRATALGRAVEPVWSAMGLTRPAEFNPDHLPAFVQRKEPRRYLCVYPYVRSLEWYLLDPVERRAMLAEHGELARGFEDVLANTVAAFGLNDYEWLLAFEADALPRIVDLMRQLRTAQARKHTRLEVPFYTGARKPLAEIVRTLP